MNTQMDELMELCLDMGEEMLGCGAEIYRVEDTLTRLCMAYGCKKSDVFSLTSMIILTTIDPMGEKRTQMRRAWGHGNNMERIEAINELCREACANPIPTDELRRKWNAIPKETLSPFWKKWVGSILAAAGFTIFFGGNTADALNALLVSLAVCAMDRWVYRSDVNRVLYMLLCSFVAGVCVLGLTRVGLGEHIDTIMIGVIMLLIPGVALTNSVRDMLGGDIVSGLLRLVESLMQAAAISGGIAAAILTFGHLFIG